MEELDVVEALRLDELIGRKVRHFKGKEYLVLGTVIHTETLETMVLYKALYETCETYVRPIKMFLSEVDKEKYPYIKQVYRFELVGDENENNIK